MEIQLLVRLIGTGIFLFGMFTDKWRVSAAGLFLIVII